MEEWHFKTPALRTCSLAELQSHRPQWGRLITASNLAAGEAHSHNSLSDVLLCVLQPWTFDHM